MLSYGYCLFVFVNAIAFFHSLTFCHRHPRKVLFHTKQFALMASSSLVSTSAQLVTGEKTTPLEQNVLKKHAGFFDRNHDGIIYPWETFQGLRAIGCGVPISAAGALFINMGLSHKTRPGKFPSPLFPIVVENIQLGKHGSDSGVYDPEGRFVSSEFEDIFSKHAHTHPNALTSEELKEMLKGNRDPKNYIGWIAAYAEWKLLYVLGKDEKGLLHKDTVRAVFDGSLFEHLEGEKKSNVNNNK